MRNDASSESVRMVDAGDGASRAAAAAAAAAAAGVVASADLIRSTATAALLPCTHTKQKQKTKDDRQIHQQPNLPRLSLLQLGDVGQRKNVFGFIEQNENQSINQK